MVTPLVARVIALTRFRHFHGVAANPEDLPGEWAECLAQARVDFDEFLAGLAEFEEKEEES